VLGISLGGACEILDTELHPKLGRKSISPQKDVLGLGRKSNTIKEKIQSIGKKVILRSTEERLTT